MMRERSEAVLEMIPERYAFPVAMISLLIGSSFALATDQNLLGVLGVLALAVVSISYGALQTPEDLQ
jgi:hypothetical protein